MCGIAGYINLKGDAGLPEIEAMTKAIEHRGPDGFGHQLFKNIAIGHRRLSIIDLEAGKQPMCSADGKIWITFNGEIYNYKEIRTELSNLGYSFKTQSDTEVIIYAYQKWGFDCLNKLRGMFAFGILDLNLEQLFLARDHFGIKPLYIYQSKHNIAFGSELYQFKKLPHFDNSINIQALDNYLWLQYIPAPLTIFNSIQKLKPAHYVTVTFKGQVSEQIKYWDISYSEKKIKTRSEWIEGVEETVKQSVNAHLVSDVPFGAFLSGGVDSTLIVKYMSEILPKPVKTFSIGFEEEEYNELKYSEEAAKKYGTEHYTQVVKPDALKLLPELVKRYGEPFGDSSALPTYYVCELAKQHVTMTLSGDGGDECFSGYTSHLNWLRGSADNYYTGLKKKLYPYANRLSPAKYPLNNTLQKWIEEIQYLDNNWRMRLWHPDFHQNIKKYPSGFEEIFQSTSSVSNANKVQFVDMKTYMSSDILTKVDIASMIHSLEVRTPLIDKNVWEFAATIPDEFNIDKTGMRWNGKMLLKQILEKDFSKDFVYRKKQGFAIPLKKWFANEGELKTALHEKLLAPTSQLNAYFNTKSIVSLLDSSNIDGMWLLLFLEEWLRQFNEPK